MACRVQADPKREGLPHVFSFLPPAVGVYAFCILCERHVTIEQWLNDEPCPGRKECSDG